MTPWPGSLYPLGATHDGAGVHFAVYSEVTDHLAVCLFDDDGTEQRHTLPEITRFVEVPIVVVTPPRMAANDNGMR